jgi:hypothetical protein
MKEMMKYMIHETLKSEGGIKETKRNDQELIVALMSANLSLGNVFLFHMYLVVARMEVKFGKVLSPIEFIQKAIYDRNSNFPLCGKLFEEKYIRKHVPSDFLLEDCENRRIIGDVIGMDNTRF